MAQRAIGARVTQWYLIARGRHGEAVIRVRPGMSLGETPAGELSFDPQCAHVELDIADNGGLALRAVDAHELKSSQGTCRLMLLDVRAEIRLPHNALHLVTDFLDRGRAHETVEVLAAEPTGDTPAAPQINRVPEAFHGEPADAPPRTDAPTDESTDEPTHASTVARPRPRRPSRDEHAVGVVVMNWRAERSGAGHERFLRPSMLALPRFEVLLIGLAIIAFALLYPGTREGSEPRPSATVGAGTAETLPARAPAAVAATTRTTEELPSAVFPSKPLVVSTKQGSQPTEPVSGGDENLLVREERTGTSSPDDGPPLTPSDESGGLRPAEPASLPQVAQPIVDSTERMAASETNDSRPEAAVEAKPDRAGETTGLAALEPFAGAPPERRSAQPSAQSVAAADAVAGLETIDSQPDAIAASRPKEVVESPRARTDEVALHALSSADLALAQGRLTSPPDANAFSLYNRVLVLDPESREARRGLQAVGQGLINRALAQLAGGALDDARSSLQTAAEAGADPMLVANLRNEVDYRQRTMNPRGTPYE